MKKKRFIYLSFILVVLLTMGAIMTSYAWVRTTKKAKIEQDELNIEGVGDLLISLNGGNSYHPSINAVNENESQYAALLQVLNLKDYTGDGINLYSPSVDPYTKNPISGGWQVIRTVEDGNKFDSTAIDALNVKNENKNYYSLEVLFKSNAQMDIYLSRNSYVLPSVTGKTGNQVLLLKRVTKYQIEALPNGSHPVSYEYFTENSDLSGLVSIGTNIAANLLPTVYNQSLYCSEFDNALDTAVFEAYSALITNEEKTSYLESHPNLSFDDDYYYYTQTKFSANFVSGAVRVAFIDEQKSGDYATVPVDLNYHGDYSNSSLRMIWAPNPLYQSKVEYHMNTNSWSYDFDIGALERTEEEVGTNRTVSVDNKFYLVDNSTLAQSGLKRFPNDIFVSNLNDGLDTVSSYEAAIRDNTNFDYKPHKLVTLTDDDGNGIYTGKIRVVMWIEGTDIEANASLTGGSQSSSSNLTEGSAKIKFLLSFFGFESSNND